MKRHSAGMRLLLLLWIALLTHQPASSKSWASAGPQDRQSGATPANASGGNATTLYFPRLVAGKSVVPYPDHIWTSCGLRGNVSALAIAPSNPNILYAAIASGNEDVTANRVFKSTDGGRSWTPILERSVATALSVHPLNPEIVFAVIQTPPSWEMVLIRSTDGGTTWDRIGHWNYCSSLQIHPADGNIVDFLAGDTLYRSRDGGTTWIDNGVDLCLA